MRVDTTGKSLTISLPRSDSSAAFIDDSFPFFPTNTICIFLLFFFGRLKAAEERERTFSLSLSLLRLRAMCTLLLQKNIGKNANAVTVDDRSKSTAARINFFLYAYVYMNKCHVRSFSSLSLSPS